MSGDVLKTQPKKLGNRAHLGSKTLDSDFFSNDMQSPRVVVRGLVGSTECGNESALAFDHPGRSVSHSGQPCLGCHSELPKQAFLGGVQRYPSLSLAGQFLLGRGGFSESLQKVLLPWCQGLSLVAVVGQTFLGHAFSPRLVLSNDYFLQNCLKCKMYLCFLFL